MESSTSKRKINLQFYEIRLELLYITTCHSFGSSIFTSITLSTCQSIPFIYPIVYPSLSINLSFVSSNGKSRKIWISIIPFTTDKSFILLIYWYLKIFIFENIHNLLIIIFIKILYLYWLMIISFNYFWS